MDYGELSADARELVLFAENDEPTYRQEQAIYKNLDKKMQKGTFSKSLAPKIFRYETDAAAKRYAKEYGGNFSTTARQEAANFLAEAYERAYQDRLASGEAFLMKKYSKPSRSR